MNSGNGWTGSTNSFREKNSLLSAGFPQCVEKIPANYVTSLNIPFANSSAHLTDFPA